MKRVAYKGGS